MFWDFIFISQRPHLCKGNTCFIPVALAWHAINSFSPTFSTQFSSKKILQDCLVSTRAGWVRWPRSQRWRYDQKNKISSKSSRREVFPDDVAHAWTWTLLSGLSTSFASNQHQTNFWTRANSREWLRRSFNLRVVAARVGDSGGDT